MTPATLAARDSAAVFLLEGRTHIEVTGAERAAFLNGFCTNDVKSLAPSQGCEAFFCNVKGHVLAHVTVFIGEQAIWLETVPGAAPGLIAHLDRYIIREDVQLHDRTDALVAACLVGPQSTTVICRMLGETDANGPRRQHVEALPVPGISPGGAGGCGLRVVNWLGTRCYLPVALAADVSQGLQAMASAGVVAGSAADWEALRIDAGFPTYAVDITEDNLPQEAARNAQCISLTKGCYLGQEPVARLSNMGHTNRELRRLSSEAADIPAPGTELLDPTTHEAVGHITSAAANPFGHGTAALGMLKRKWLAADTRLQTTQGDFIVR